MSPLLSNIPGDSARCPFMTPELQKLRENHTNLASTGCTKEICQAGRAIHTDEPRIGENRAIHAVEQDAECFLRELYNEGFFRDQEEFESRLKHARDEIRSNAVEGLIREDKVTGLIGGNWTQTPRELEFGLRRAWRNARKCIMRSHCEELGLCDLRSVTSSARMARELIKGMSKAFNNGIIQPTAFVFPPRTANSRGPMIWNHQLLAFAGYEAGDGSVIGDPMNVQLTKEIIELGWEPPLERTRWDLLPLVTMAEGDLPVIAELPSNLRNLVEIRHPQYGTEFRKLDLKWVSFPALTRLGFDIGGVQYTAAPFIGWFMDAEIGVRNLADSFRYNVLPVIIDALDLTRGRLVNGADCLEDLPEYERLAMLSRAQSELNYAVHWSYLQAKINMTDTLTASMKWCHYDDEFKKKNGYRLPADPYWLAPPQGSIVPLWHRGGAPNYQPKPMICKHVEDPVKAWGREKHDWSLMMSPLRSVAILGQQQDSRSLTDIDQRLSFLQKAVAKKSKISIPQVAIVKSKPQQYGAIVYTQNPVETAPANTHIAIYYCSAGTIAKRLATKLHQRAVSWTKGSSAIGVANCVRSLDNLEASDLSRNKIILLVVSSTGQGDIPANGSEFADMCGKLSASSGTRGFRFAVFGNGDSRYVTTYNGAAKKIHEYMTQVSGTPLTGEVFHGDTAVEVFPLSSLSLWWSMLKSRIGDLVTDRLEKHIVCSVQECGSDSDTFSESFMTEISVTEYTEEQETHEPQPISDFQTATLVAVTPEVDGEHRGALQLTLNVGSTTYKDLSVVQVLPVSSPSKVERALKALCVDGSTRVETIPSSSEGNPSYEEFVTEIVDLELPFQGLQWLESLQSKIPRHLTREVLARSSALEVLETLCYEGVLPFSPDTSSLLHELFLDMAPLRSRNFSVASSLSYLDTECKENGNKVDIIVKVYPGGRFSDTFLHDCSMPASLKVRFVDSISSDRLRTTHLAPLVIVATGAGFGPVRCLLQQRIATARDESRVGSLDRSSNRAVHKMSLFLGFKRNDVAMTTQILQEAAKWQLLDTVCIVPSNADKIRVQDGLKSEKVKAELRDKLLRQQGFVFVCTSPVAAKAIKSVFADLLGGNVARVLGERFVEEVY